MKKTIILLSGIFFLIHFSAFTQVNLVDSKITSLANPPLVDTLNYNTNIFSKGIWNFSVATNNLHYSNENYKFNGMDKGDQTNFSVNFNTKYYVVDHFAVGLYFRADSYRQKDVTKQTNSSWSTSLNLTYGTNITEKLGFYGTIGAGIGGSTYKYSYQSNTTTDKQKDYGFRVGAGFPIQLDHISNVRFTPQVYYSYLNNDFEDGTQKDNYFGLKMKLEASLFCRQMSCGCSNGHSLAEHMYDGGRSFIGFSTYGKVEFGSSKITYDDNYYPPEKQTNSNVDIRGEYMHYIVDGLAVGGTIGFQEQGYKNKDNDSKNSSCNWRAGPMVEYNLPFKSASLKSIFIKGGVEFGGQTFKNTYGNTTNTDKNTIIDPCFGFGYNMFFAKNLALTLLALYEWETIKNKENDDKQRYNGVYVGLGTRYFLR